MGKTELVEIEDNAPDKWHSNDPVTPMSLVQMAVEQNADLDKLERLMVMQEKWEANEARKAFNHAIAKFRAECPPIKKTKKAHNSKYAGLSETVEQIKPHLEACGLSYTWHTSQANGCVSVTCKVTHIMGHSDETTLFSDPDTSGSKNSIQSIGSAVSYLQRYTLTSILGLASTDEFDDDGNGVAALDTKAVIELLESAKTMAELDSRATHALKLDKQGKADARKVYMQRKKELSE